MSDYNGMKSREGHVRYWKSLLQGSGGESHEGGSCKPPCVPKPPPNSSSSSEATTD